MARGKFWTVLAAAGLAVAAGAYLYLERAGPPAGGAAEAVAPKPAAERVVVVEAAPAERDAVVEDIRAVGSLLPDESVVVSPEIAGRVERIAFGEGDRVEAGQLLVELDATILRAEMTKARSDLTLAEANRERAVTLASQGTGTLRARDEALAAYSLAQANVALAQARLEKSSLAAPFAGVVGFRSVSLGAYVEPGDPLVELSAIDPIKVDFRVPELALSSLRRGQRINVTVDAVPGRDFEGAVYAIDPVVDANGRAVRLRARIDNPGHLLSPGLFARVQIVVERREDAVLVPESAIFAEGRQRYLYRVVDGRALLTPVELGQRRPGRVEVRSGLAAGDLVVTAGHQQLRDGSRVEVVAMAGAAAPAEAGS